MRRAFRRELEPDRPSSRWVRPLLMVVLVGLTGWIVVGNRTAFADLMTEAELLPLVLAMAFGILGQFLNAWIAKVSLGVEGTDAPLRIVYRILAVGGMAKYIPGGVWQVASQVGIGRAYGIGTRGAVLAWLEPTAFNVTIGGGLAFMLASSIGYPIPTPAFLVAGAGLLIASAEPARRRVYRLLRLTVDLPDRTVVAAWITRATITGVIVLSTGAAGMLVISAFPIDSQPTLLQSSAAFTGAWVIGVLAFPVPGGLGVREGALVLALSPWMPPHQALLVAAASRLVAMVGELVSGLISVAVPDPATAPSTRTDISYIGPLPPIRGGISQHGERLVRSLEESGRTVTRVSWRSLYPALLYPGVAQVVRSPTHVLRWWSVRSWLAGRTLARAAGTVLFPWVTPFHAIPLWVMLRRLDALRIAIMHNASPHERFPASRVLTRWVMREADVITCLSTSVAEDVQRLTGKTPHVLHHASNLDVHPQPRIPTTHTRLLFLGYVRPYKGLDILLEAVSMLDRNRFRLTVAGDAWEPPKRYEDLASDLALSDVVAFRFGYVPDSELAALLASHDLVVQSYRSASQSGVVPLAHAAGRAVVVTPVGGLKEQVTDGINGVVARSTDPADVAAAIRRAADDLDDLTAGATATAPSWESVVAEITKLEALSREKGLD
jgi:glycosyltransferase involved in cell wall biosynthesis